MQNYAFDWINGSTIHKQVLQLRKECWESTDLEFRHMLIYFFRCQGQRFSESQIFFFVFSTLRIFFPTFFACHTYLSNYIFYVPKKLRKSVKCKAFIAKIKIRPKYLWTDFRISQSSWRHRISPTKAGLWVYKISPPCWHK